MAPPVNLLAGEDCPARFDRPPARAKIAPPDPSRAVTPGPVTMPRRDLPLSGQPAVGLLLASAADVCGLLSRSRAADRGAERGGHDGPAPPAEMATPLPPAPPAAPTHAHPGAPTPTATEVPPTENPRTAGPRDGVCRRLRVPILMYHYISAAGGGQRGADDVLPPKSSRLAYLEANGYTSVSLEDLARAPAGHPLPDKPVILTSMTATATTTLRPSGPARHGFTGTFSVVTGYLDEERPEYPVWEQSPRCTRPVWISPRTPSPIRDQATRRWTSRLADSGL